MNKKFFVFLILAINIILAILTQSFTENIEELKHLSPYLTVTIFILSITLGSIVDILIITLIIRICSVLMKNQISKNNSFKYGSITYIGTSLFSAFYLMWLLLKDKANLSLDETNLPVYFNLGFYVSLLIIFTILFKSQKKSFFFSIIIIFFIFIYKILTSIIQ